MEACEQLQPLEIILTINGDIQDSIESADPYNFEIITLEEPIDSTNLYVIGAKKAKGQYLLFLDKKLHGSSPYLYNFFNHYKMDLLTSY